MTKALRCALYTRKSSEEGLEQNFNSLHAQREACEAYVLSQTGEGWVAIASPYDDGGFSGGTMARPGLQQLMADIEKGLIDIVVVYKVDRLTRSLADFAKIVELFDAKGVSFVSVTQAFNTTSSMGRLTLNVLLSFAQFEREVTGERIRDKITASKAKGLRMGGTIPLGYDLIEGRLRPNDAEAQQVRHVFRRYAELGSLTALAREGPQSKTRIGADGVSTGGKPMTTGGLAYLLANPVYRGVNRHKDRSYPDCHPAIVDEPLWDSVQQLLAVRKGRHGGRPRLAERGKLAGLLFDDRGSPMRVVHVSRRGKFYRYYLSHAKIKGVGTPGTLPRISTHILETFLADKVAPLLAASHAPDAEAIVRVATAITRVTLSEDQVTVHAVESSVAPDALAGLERPDEATCVMRFAFHTRRRQGAVLIEPSGVHAMLAARPDRALIRAVVLARSWATRLETGEAKSIGALARHEGLCEHYTSRLLPLAYLAPDITAAIVEGRQPQAMTLSALTAKPIPTAWQAQRGLVQRLASGL